MENNERLLNYHCHKISKYYDRCWDKTHYILTKVKYKYGTLRKARRLTKTIWDAYGMNKGIVDTLEQLYPHHKRCMLNDIGILNVREYKGKTERQITKLVTWEEDIHLNSTPI